jgi:hypothetical protein
MFISTFNTPLHIYFVFLFIPALLVCQSCSYFNYLITYLNQDWLVIRMPEHLYCKLTCIATCQLAQPRANLHNPHVDLHSSYVSLY